MVNSLSAMQKAWVQSLGWEDILENSCRREWQLAPVFFPRESHGERNLLHHGPWCHKELDMTEQQAYTHCYVKTFRGYENIFIFE